MIFRNVQHLSLLFGIFYLFSFSVDQNEPTKTYLSMLRCTLVKFYLIIAIYLERALHTSFIACLFHTVNIHEISIPVLQHSY